MRLSWGVRTDRGCVRQLNEDAALAAPPVFVVADGMGGHAAGEVASGLVVECFAELVRRLHAEQAASLDPQPADSPADSLVNSPEDSLVNSPAEGPAESPTDNAAEAPEGAARSPIASGSISAEAVLSTLIEANRRILAHSDAVPESAGLGTTVSGIAVVENGGRQELFAFNIGDSRLYRLAREGLEQVSVDHSAVQELIDGGMIDADSARTHPARNVVTRALGSSPAPRPDLWFLEVKAGDRFVLGTDGLFGDVPPDALHAAAQAADPAVAAELLVGLAIEAGGRDNITTVVLEVLSPNDDDRPDDESTTPRTASAEGGWAETAEVETTQPRPQAVGLLERDPDRPRSRAVWSDREGDR